MATLTRILFGLADTVIGLSIIATIIAIGRMFFASLDATLSPDGFRPESTTEFLLIWGLFVAVVVWAAIGIFAYILLLRRQVVGLCIVVVQGLAGYVFPLLDPVIYTWILVTEFTVLSLPWLLTYVDMKRRGTIPG